MSSKKRVSSTRFRIYVRHHCRNCGSRIFPFDKYENRTEVSSAVNKQRRVLLYSANARDVTNRMAWCWSCKAFVSCERLTEDEILLMYLQRKGVVTRK
jgi:hypothetical protein